MEWRPLAYTERQLLAVAFGGDGVSDDEVLERVAAFVTRARQRRDAPDRYDVLVATITAAGLFDNIPVRADEWLDLGMTHGYQIFGASDGSAVKIGEQIHQRRPDGLYTETAVFAAFSRLEDALQRLAASS